jgi:hypothetical protein
MKDTDQESFWPGYVDAMSNMVLTLIFVVLVLALTLSLYSMRSAQQMAERIYLRRVTTPEALEGGRLVETSAATGFSFGDSEAEGSVNDLEAATAEPGSDAEPLNLALLPPGVEASTTPPTEATGLFSSETSDGADAELAGAPASFSDGETAGEAIFNEQGSSPGEQDVLELMLEELRTALSQLETGSGASAELGGGGSGAVHTADAAAAEGEQSAEQDEKLRSALDFARQLRIKLSEVQFQDTPQLSVVEVMPEDGSDISVQAALETETQTQVARSQGDVATQASFLPATVEAEEDRPLDFAGATGLTITATASGEATVQLSVRNGTMAVEADAAVQIEGSGTSTLTVAGPAELVNETMKSLTYLGSQDFYGNDTLTLLANNATGASIIGTTQIEVLSVNDAPIAVESMVTALEDRAYVFRQSDFQFEDIERNALSAVVIETLPTGGSLYYRGRAIEEGATITAEQLQDGELTFRPADDANGRSFSAFDFRVVDDGGTANDGENISAASARIQIDVIGTPDAPVSFLPQAVRVGEDDEYAFRGSETITVNDADGNLVSVELSVGNGTLQLAEDLAGSVTGRGTPTVRIEGTQTEINALLATLTYRGNPDFFGSDTLSLKATDAENATVLSSAAITVTPVNDAPVGQPGRLAVVEAVPYSLRISDFAFRDIENDALAAVRIDTLPSVGRLEKDGAAVAVGAVLTAEDLVSGRLVYVVDPQEAAVGEASFEFTVTDDGGTDEGGADTASEPARLTIEINQLPGARVADAAEAIAGEGETEPSTASGQSSDAAGVGAVANAAPLLDASRRYDLSPILEDIAVEENSGTRLSDLFAQVASDTDAEIVETGIFLISSDGIPGQWEVQYPEDPAWSAIDLSQAEEELAYLVGRDASLRFVPAADANGRATIMFGAWDEREGRRGERIEIVQRGGSTAFSEAVATAQIEVLAVNDPPAHILPGPQSLAQDDILVFGDALGNALSVNDLRDASQPGGTDFLETTLSVAQGRLAPRDGAVLEAEIVGAGTGTVTLSGQASAINAALSGFSYRPATGFAGTDVLTILTRDFGNTGDGGELTASDAVELIVEDRNDAPSLDSLGVYELSAIEEDMSLEANIGTRIGDLLGDGVRDPDASDLVGGIYVTTLDDAMGRWQARHSGQTDWRDIVVSGERGGSAYLIGPEDVLRFLPEPDKNGTAALVFGAWDGSEGSVGTWVNLTARGGSSAFSEELATAKVTIAAVNDAPENKVPSEQAISQGETLVFGDAFGNPISVNDARDTGQPGATDMLEAVLEVRNGILSPRDGTEFSAEIIGAGSNALTIRGAERDVNSVLSGLTYRPDENSIGSEEIRLTTSDLGYTGLGGELTTTDPILVTIEEVETVLAGTAEPETEAPVDEEGNTTQDLVQIEGDLQSGIVISFPSQIVVLDPDTELTLKELVSRVEDFRTATLELRVYSPSPNLNVERTAAITRGISVRQVLIDTGVAPEGVGLMVVTNERSEVFGEIHIRMVGG